MGFVEEIRDYVREIPDYPTPGVSFKDITPLIGDGKMLRTAVESLENATSHLDYTSILSAEARGFVLGTALAYRAEKGLVLARKPGRLPRRVVSATYELEYGPNALEAHEDSITPESRLLVVDDLLATGGTARAMCELVENCGGTVAATAFLIELSYLEGRQNLSPYPVISLLQYEQ